MKVYQAINRELERQARNLGDDENFEKLIEDAFPNGSGFDSQIFIDSTNPEKFSLVVPYHCMSDNGFYDGWIEVVYTVTPSFYGFHMKANWKGYKGKYKELLADYIGHTIYNYLDNEVNSVFNQETKQFEYEVCR